MGAYCTIYPQVRSAKTGELVNSKLFADLKKAVGYKNARRVYLAVRDGGFIEEHEQELTRDENGEFTIESLKSIPELSPVLGVRVRRSVAAKNVDAYEPLPATRENIMDAEKRSMDYNSKPGNEFVAIPEIYEDNDGTQIVQIKLVKNNPENRELASRISRKQVLVSRLSNALRRVGIDESVVDILLDKLSERGYDEYDATIAIAENLQALISKANGQAADVNMPEEMSVLVFASIMDTPLMSRLRSAVSKNGVAESILGEDYDAIAEQVDDESDLEEIAIGRLISRYIIDENGDNPELGSISSLVSRIKSEFNNIISGIGYTEISSYLRDARRSPATSEIEDEMNDVSEIDFNQETDKPEFKELHGRVKKMHDLLYDIIETNVRRYKILSARDSGYDKAFDKNLTSDLYARWQDEEYELGIFEFVDATLTQLSKAEEKIIELRDSEMSIERKAQALKNIKDFIESYRISIDAIKKAEFAGVIKPSKEREDILNQASAMIGNLNAAYEALKNPILISFVKRFVGEGLEVPFGNEKGKVYTAEMLLEKAEKDITVFDRWLDSMAESGDVLLRMLDATSKKARSSARLETIEYKKRLDAAYLKLKNSGITDTSFMFAKDPNGHKTGKYISAAEAELLDIARKNYYKEVMSIKNELDAKLPKGSTSLLNIVRVRKDYIERLKGQDSISGVVRETKEALRDKVKRRSDNPETDGRGEIEGSDEGVKKTVLMDFSGRQVEILPIMFVNSKDGESLDDISEDVTSSMLMYANMACNFSAMNNVVGLLELVREKINERPVQQRAGAKPLVNVLKAFGIEVATDLTKTGEATNIVKRMNDWFSSQVYSRYMKDEGEILGMDVGMLANLSNEITALNQFALNILSGISNVMTASAMNRIESICGQYFSVKDLAKADTVFWSALPDFLGDVGQPVKHSKLALFMEKFNTMQDFESDVREPEYAKSRFARLMTTNSLYVINNAGELWIQNRAAIALGQSYGLRDANGKPISLWDSQEVVTDKNGVSRLVTKPGIKKADGTLFDDNTDVLKFTNKAKSINQRMNGIYNYEDRCAAQAYSWGRIALMFRKWIKPSLNRRYASLNYNFDVEEWEEGFYTTTGRFFMQLVKDLKRGQLDIVTSYKNLDPREQANLMRFAVEVGQFISVCAAFAILKNIKKNTDDDEALAKSWWFNQLLYQTRRLESEIGSQMIINPQMIQEAFNILKSPAACVNTWEGVTNMAQLMIPSNYTKILQTGRYKGHSKAYKLFWDSPLIPMHRTIYRGFHPQNSLQFYDL